MKRDLGNLSMTWLTFAILVTLFIGSSRSVMADSEKVDAESVAEWLLTKKK